MDIEHTHVLWCVCCRLVDNDGGATLIADSQTSAGPSTEYQTTASVDLRGRSWVRHCAFDLAQFSD
jgi:hypothetical protein